MKINYKITRDDYIAFNMAHVKRTTSIHLMIVILRLLVPVLSFFYTAYVGRLTDPIYIGIFTLFSVPWIIFSPRIIWISMVRQINKVLDDGQVGELFSHRTIEFKEDCIIETTSQTTTTYKWESIVSMEETERAVYLYTSPVQALILPKKTIKSFSQLSRIIQKKMRK